MIRHGMLNLEIATLLRSAIPLAPDAADGSPHNRDQGRIRRISGKFDRQTRVRARPGRIVVPSSPTAPASAKR